MSALIIGLTGGIGSGKSSVAEMFRELGAGVVDADAIAHELTAADGLAMPAIATAFGNAVVSADGALDRTQMRQRVFADPQARQQLEAILHPMIRRLSAERCVQSPAPYVLLVVPLLIESGYYRERLQRLLVVDCPEEIQISRVMARSGMSEAEVRGVMAAQASREQRLAAADDVIDNSADFHRLEGQVLALHAKYAKMAGIG